MKYVLIHVRCDKPGFYFLCEPTYQSLITEENIQKLDGSSFEAGDVIECGSCHEVIYDHEITEQRFVPCDENKS